MDLIKGLSHNANICTTYLHRSMRLSVKQQRRSIEQYIIRRRLFHACSFQELVNCYCLYLYLGGFFLIPGLSRLKICLRCHLGLNQLLTEPLSQSVSLSIDVSDHRSARKHDTPEHVSYHHQRVGWMPSGCYSTWLRSFFKPVTEGRGAIAPAIFFQLVKPLLSLSHQIGARLAAMSLEIIVKFCRF